MNEATQGEERMTYNEAKAKIFARGTIPDGYFGKRAAVGFALIGERIVTVADCGYFGAGLPDVASEEEALWIIKKHPSAKNITLSTLAA